MSPTGNAPAPTSPQAEQSNRLFILAIVGIVVAGIAVLAVLFTNRGSGELATAAEEQTAEVTIDGTALPAMPEGVRVTSADIDPAVGTVAPTLTGTDFAGDTVTIGADGTPKVVYFVAHWCPHCQNEVPLIQDLIDTDQTPDGLDIYAVSTSVDQGLGNFPPATWLEDEGFTPLTIRDTASADALLAYGAGSFPYAVYLDGDNQVVARSVGSFEQAEILELWTFTAAQ